MKYRFYQFMNAQHAIKKLMAMDFNVKDSYKLFKMAKQFDAVMQFGAEREKALLAKYDGRILPDGYIQFVHSNDEEAKSKGEENMASFQREISELHDMEVNEEITPITLGEAAMSGKEISANDIMALDGFVAFE